jgi:hypothetical protein
MNDIDGIRKFQYRPSRMKAHFDVDFIGETETFPGICVDISAAGIRAEFDGIVVVGSSGVLILRSQLGVLNLEAQVTYAVKSVVGIVFRFKTPLERGIAIRFIDAIAEFTRVLGSR